MHARTHFPRIFLFSQTFPIFPDHSWIPWLFQVFHVSGQPVCYRRLVDKRYMYTRWDTEGLRHTQTDRHSELKRTQLNEETVNEVKKLSNPSSKQTPHKRNGKTTTEPYNVETIITMYSVQGQLKYL